MIGNNILFLRKRSIAGFLPKATVKEDHEDSLEITRHPVEEGAKITDHAYKMPARITMRCYFSDFGVDFAGSLFSISLSSIQDVYNALLKLQESRIPFDVVTGKRSYTNMLLAHLSVETDVETEHILSVNATMEQIIIVPTEISSIAAIKAGSTASGKKYSGVKNSGRRALKSVSKVENSARTGGYIGVPLK